MIAKLRLDQPYKPEAERKLEAFSLLEKIKKMKINQAMRRAEEDKRMQLVLAMKSINGVQYDEEYILLVQRRVEAFMQSVYMIQRCLKNLVTKHRRKMNAILDKKMEERHHFFQRAFMKVNIMNNKVLSA